MKKLLTTALILLSVSVWSQTPLMIGATYLSCSDSLHAPLNTGESMAITKNTNNGVKTYTITGSSPTQTYIIKVKDPNAGQIQAGDSIRVSLATFSICGVAYSLQNHEAPIVTLDGNMVEIIFEDCILPLNGSNATIKIRFMQ